MNWSRPFLQWLDAVQTKTGVRRYPAGVMSQLVARHDVGETVDEATAWIKEMGL